MHTAKHYHLLKFALRRKSRRLSGKELNAVQIVLNDDDLTEAVTEETFDGRESGSTLSEILKFIWDNWDEILARILKLIDIFTQGETANA